MKNNLFCVDSDLTQQPVILEEHGLKATAIDIYSRLLMDRIIFVGSEINSSMANTIMAQLIYLNSKDNERPIQMYINSPGGDIVAGLQIYDTMQLIKAPIQTVCTGMAASMAAVLLAGGKKGQRAILPNASTMIHQPLGGAWGQATDVEIANKQIQMYKNRLYQLLAADTGKDIETIKNDCERDYWLDANAALKYGLVDKVINGKNIL